MRKITFILFLAFSTLFTACEKELGYQSIPYTLVSEEINLSNLQYADLKDKGGYVYLNNAGYRGLIIYNAGDGAYRAFDRACSYDPKSDCDPLVVDDSGLFIKHECCGSLFDFNGNPMGGPASIDLLQYQTYVDGNYLKITN